MCQNGQLSPTLLSVITLGHSPNVPLMRALSELLDGLEPHDHVLLHRTAACTRVAGHGDQQGGGEGVPGVVGWVGTREGYTGYPPTRGPEAGLTLIYRY